jgi:hypothetical protein
LQRKPAILSAGTSIPGERLKFIAFPPASFIAKGASPLALHVGLEATGEKPALKISRAQSLPNVDGPLFDHCGYLSGFNLSTGIPSLEGDLEVNTLLGTEFQDLVQAFGHDLKRTICSLDAEAEITDIPLEEQTDSGAESVVEEESRPEGIDESDGGIEQEALTTSPVLQAEASLEDSTPIGMESRPEQSFPWMVTLVVLVTLSLLLGLYWRRKSVPDNSAPQTDPVEPATEQLVVPTQERSPETCFTVLQVEDDSLLTQFEEGCDTLIMLEGTGTSGQAFRCSKAVFADQFQFELVDSDDNGNLFDTGDKSLLRASIEGISGDDGWVIMVSIPGAGARINIAGITIRGVPCLPGEKMHLSPGDELLLGSSRFIVKLIGRQGRTA